MQPVDTGGSIIGCHDSSENLLCLGDGSGSRVWDLYVLESELTVALFVEAVLRREAGVLLVTAMQRELTLQADGERVFLVGKLVDEVTSVTPEREVVRVRGRCIEGGPRAILIVVEQISRIAFTRA